MSADALTDVQKRTKPRKTPAHLRKTQILALQTAGLTQQEIAQKLGVSRRTIAQDLEDLRPAQQQVASLLSEINDEYAKLQTPRQIAENYVSIATESKQDIARLQAQDRILEHRGVITDRERLRAKAHEPAPPAPMFQLPAGVSVAITLSSPNNDESLRQIETTTSRESASSHNTPTVTPSERPTTSSNEDDDEDEQG